jgi:hypothetical protein
MNAACTGPVVDGSAKALESGNTSARKERDWRDAGKNRFPFNHDSTGAALPKATAIFGAVQLQVVAQHIEQRRVGLGIDLMVCAVDCQGDHDGFFALRTSAVRLGHGGSLAAARRK